MVIDFIILEDFSSKDLSANIKKKLAEGWELHGTLSIVMINNPHRGPIPKFFQAMIQHDVVVTVPPVLKG